ncbi:MAG: tRNA methyltransferase [Nitrososphaeraceae archaeon]|nr:tRNA methyltransferase [Nitrososphaeraceae archaeon]
MKIEDNSQVLLFHTQRKKWLVNVEKDKKFHTHLGIIDFNSIIGMEFGQSVRTATDNEIFLIKPTIHDFIMKSTRGTQIVYPKDLGFIAIRTGLKNGSNVLEIGTGSGALTTFMASIVKPEGHVYTFDVNPKFMEIAKKNLTRSGMIDYVTMNHHDPHEGIQNLKDIDVAVVDLGDPWSIIEQVKQVLNGSGGFVSICPTMNQCEKTVASLKKYGFIDIECVELLIRNIEAREGMTRPSMRMIGHTTYLVFARKSFS